MNNSSKLTPAEASPYTDRPSAVNVLRIVRRRWPTLLATLVVTVGASVALDAYEKKMYSAVSVVYLNPVSLSSQVQNSFLPATDSLSLARAAETQSQIASSPQVARLALEAAKVRDLTPHGLVGETSITPESNADLLDFKVTDASPARAEALANAYADAYIRARLQLDTTPLQLALTKLQATTSKLGDSGRGNSALYSNLVEKEQQLQSLMDLDTSNASVVQRPTSAPQVRPKKVTNGVLAVLVGLILGAVLMWIRENLDARLRSPQEIDEALAMPLLGKLSPPPTAQLVTFADPNGAGAEEFRLLRANLDFAAIALPGVRAFLFSSAQPSEGKSTTVANFAVTLARLGKKTLIIDLDFRRPRQAALFGVTPRFGLTDVIRKRASFTDALEMISVSVDDANPRGIEHAETIPAVSLLDTGPSPFNVGDFLALPAVSVLIREVTDSLDYDFVLIDTPPIGAFADALSVIKAAQALVLVARLDALTRPSARDLRRVLSMSTVPCLGYVLTGARDGVATSGYGYGYGYSYRDSATGREERRVSAREPEPKSVGND